VLIGDDWLAITRFGRCRRVRTDRLVGLSENPRVAGSMVLADEDGNSAEIDVRCLVRNPADLAADRQRRAPVARPGNAHAH
jgi:hypothetical protein